MSDKESPFSTKSSDNVPSYRRSTSASSSLQDESGAKSDGKVGEASLNPWQKWLLRKTIAQVEKSQNQQSQIQVGLGKDKRQRSKEAYAVWLQEKNKVLVSKKLQEQAKLKKEKTEWERERENIQRLSAMKYAAWMQSKETKLKEQKKELKFQQQQELDMRSKKKEQGEEAFKKWLSKQPKGSRIEKQSYAHSGDVLISYYDGASMHKPEFCNPVPWVNPLDCSEDGQFHHICQQEAKRYLRRFRSAEVLRE